MKVLTSTPIDEDTIVELEKSHHYEDFLGKILHSIIHIFKNFWQFSCYYGNFISHAEGMRDKA